MDSVPLLCQVWNPILNKLDFYITKSPEKNLLDKAEMTINVKTCNDPAKCDEVRIKKCTLTTYSILPIVVKLGLSDLWN